MNLDALCSVYHFKNTRYNEITKWHLGIKNTRNKKSIKSYNSKY